MKTETVIDEIEALCKWVKETKGITVIDIIKIRNFKQ